MSLIHCIYSSAAVDGLHERELPRILEASRRNNEALGVTGMLLHVDGSFFQVLEGPAEAVDSLFARIGQDARHARVTCIIRETIAHRSFADWTMGFVSATSDDVCRIVGRNDFFGGGACLTALDEGRAKRLLSAFARGRWRTRVSALAA